MIEQLELGAFRRTDPATSRKAAARQRGGAELAALALFDQGLELTDSELAAALPQFYAPTLTSARSRLKRDGFVYDTGRVRLSARGSESIVWARLMCEEKE